MLKNSVPEHIKDDVKLVAEWKKIIWILVGANIGTVAVTAIVAWWMLLVGMPELLWAVFMSFTIVTQVSTWAIAMYTYYQAMMVRMTIVKAGTTATDLNKFMDEVAEPLKEVKVEIKKYTVRLKRLGITMDFVTDILEGAEQDWKELSEEDRKALQADIREQIRKKIHELKQAPGEVPVPDGRVDEKGDAFSG